MRLSSFAVPSSPFIAVAALLLLVTPVAHAQMFTESAAVAGLQITHNPDLNVPIGGGTVWEDYDADGDWDVYMTQGIGCNQLFLNDGAGNFTAVANAGGADDCAGLGHGGTAADFDNDGDADIYVTNWGQNQYFVNQLVETGSLSFVNGTVAAGMDNDGANNSSSAVAGDYDNDGDLDLFVGNHFFQMPDVLCDPDLLWRNEGDGTFTEIAEDVDIASNGLSGIDGQNGCSLGSTWTDYDMDGDLDLMIINDFGPQLSPNKLYRNDGPGGPGGWIFTDVSESSGFDYVMFGMGIAKADYDHDGDFDYYMVDIGKNEFGQSQLSQGSATFIDVATEAGVEAWDPDIFGGADGLVSWGPVFADLDNDGWEDLISTHGGAPETEFPGMFGDDYVDENPNYIYRNLGDGTFVEKHADIGIVEVGYHRSGTVCDVDDDGDLDIHFGVDKGNNRFYVNDTGATNWLKVDVEGTVGNRDGVGAKIDITSGDLSLMREIEGGSSFLSLNCRTAHFGLGAVTELDSVLVTFLSGLTYEVRDVPAGSSLEIVEPNLVAEPQTDSFVVEPGDLFETPVQIVNLTDDVAVFDVWINLITLAGNEQVFRGPLEQVLQPGDSVVRTLRVNVPGTANPGDYQLIVRTGDFDTDEVVDQSYIDVTIQ